MTPNALDASGKRRVRKADGGGAKGGYTSREAAWLSGVPFFTVDSWDRTGFLRPTIAPGAGRGKGRERMYSHADVLRLRIARALRDQDVSLQTLRSLLKKLGKVGHELETARYVVVREEVGCVRSKKDAVQIATRPGAHTLSLLIDMRSILAFVEEHARSLRSERRRHGRLVGRRSGVESRAQV